MINFIATMIIVLSGRSLPLPLVEQYAQETIDAARSNDLNPIWFAALVRDESRYNHRAVSRAGAYGLSQLNPIYYPPEEHRTSWLQLYRGATVLAAYKAKCGSRARAVTAYRSGRCGPPTAATNRVMRTFWTWSARWAHR